MVQIWFAFETRSDSYFINLDPRNSPGAALNKRVGGTTTGLATVQDVTYSANEWERTKVDWGEDGSIDVTVFDAAGNTVLTLSATDTAFSGGGVAWYSDTPDDNTGTCAFDIAEITDTTTDTTETGVVDDFEDGDLSEYSEAISNNSLTGDEGEIVTSPVNSGTYAVEVYDDDNPGSNYWIDSQSGLDRYPEAGDTFEYYVYHDTSTTRGRIRWCSQSSGYDADYYSIGLDLDNSLRIVKNDSGNFQSLSSTSIAEGSKAGSWLRVKVEHTASGDITATLYDSGGTQLASVSATDTTFTSGGIGFGIVGNTSGDIVYYDDASIL